MKKTMKLALLACFILFACALMFTACEKEDTQTSNDAADVSDTTTINNVTNATANNDAVNNLRKEDALKEGQRIYKEMYEADIADGIHEARSMVKMMFPFLRV